MEAAGGPIESLFSIILHVLGNFRKYVLLEKRDRLMPVDSLHCIASHFVTKCIQMCYTK